MKQDIPGNSTEQVSLNCVNKSNPLSEPSKTNPGEIVAKRNPHPQADEMLYKRLQETEPEVFDIWTRLNWLRVKQHYGPLSTAERNELDR